MQPFCFFGSYHKMKYINQNFYDMKKILIALLVLTSFLQISCSSDTVNNSPTINPVDVYVAGSKNNQACYWKNNQLEMLDSGGFLYTTASKIIVSNGDVYVLGRGSNGTTANDFSFYWKNGVFTNLNAQFDHGGNLLESVTDFDIVGNDIYFVGYTRSPIAIPNPPTQLVLWKNNVATIIHSFNELTISDSRIKVLNNDVYIAGPNNNSSFNSGYYKNSVFNEIQNMYIRDFTVNNNEMSVYGSYQLSNRIHNITTNTDINIGFANDAQITDLCFDNNNLYYSNNNEIYKNGTLIYSIPTGLGNGLQNFKVLNGNVYKLENYGDLILSQYLKINDTILLTAQLGEYFNSLYIVQN